MDHLLDLPAASSGRWLGYLTLWSVFWLFKLATGKEGMGYGDFKLARQLGAWLGWQMLPRHHPAFVSRRRRCRHR
jgi:leader peptidase (prepilin peptidase)/N-methyltransferase